MEDLLTNPLIIAAIIGIISAIFGKKSKEEKQNSQKEKTSTRAICFSSKEAVKRRCPCTYP